MHLVEMLTPSLSADVPGSLSAQAASLLLEEHCGTHQHRTYASAASIYTLHTTSLSPPIINHFRSPRRLSPPSNYNIPVPPFSRTPRHLYLFQGANGLPHASPCMQIKVRKTMEERKRGLYTRRFVGRDGEDACMTSRQLFLYCLQSPTSIDPSARSCPPRPSSTIFGDLYVTYHKGCERALWMPGSCRSSPRDAGGAQARVVHARRCRSR